MTSLTSRGAAVLVAAVGAALALASCGGGGSQTDASADHSAAGNGGGGSGGATGGTGGAVGGGGRGGNTGGTGGNGGAGGPHLEIRNLSVYGNCQPIVPPDPIMATWTSAVTGATSSNATLVSAVLTITEARTITQTLTVTPTSVPLTNGAGSVAQQKTAGAPAPGTACDVCGGNARLDVTLDDAGTQFSATATGTFNCAF